VLPIPLVATSNDSPRSESSNKLVIAPEPIDETSRIPSVAATG
jgi:hypothetical protein